MTVRAQHQKNVLLFWFNLLKSAISIPQTWRPARVSLVPDQFENPDSDWKGKPPRQYQCIFVQPKRLITKTTAPDQLQLEAYGLKGGDFEFPTKHFFFAGKDFQPLELEKDMWWVFHPLVSFGDIDQWDIYCWYGWSFMCCRSSEVGQHVLCCSFLLICSCWLLVVKGITWLDLCGDSPNPGWPSTSHGTALTTPWRSLGPWRSSYRFSALTAPTPEAQSSWCGAVGGQFTRSVHPGRFSKGVAFW